VAALSMKPAYMRIGGVKAGRSQLAICRQFFKHPQIAVMGENRLVLDSL
jgi:septum site-determining protein MinC